MPTRRDVLHLAGGAAAATVLAPALSFAKGAAAPAASTPLKPGAHEPAAG